METQKSPKDFFVSSEIIEIPQDRDESWLDLVLQLPRELAEALQISKAGARKTFLNSPDFPTLWIGGRELVMKNELLAWLKSRANQKE